MKKYVLAKVISQIMIRRTRPMPHDPPSRILALPHCGPLRIPGDQKSGETQTGANISQLFLSASGFLYGSCINSFLLTKLLLATSCKSFPDNFSDFSKDALTKFFVLSNIRFVSGGSSEMLRTSRCFRITLSQSDGPRTLAARARARRSLSSPSAKHFESWGRPSPFTADKSKSFLKRCGTPVQAIFDRGQTGLITGGERAALSGTADYFRGQQSRR